MGIGAAIKALVSCVHEVRQGITTNPRALRAWGQQILRIANAPDVSETTKQEILRSGQQFQATLMNRSGDHPDGGSKTPLISPEVQDQRSRDILRECEKLNGFKATADKPEVLEKAISDDREDFRIQWEGLARGLQRDARDSSSFDTCKKHAYIPSSDNTIEMGAETREMAIPKPVVPNPEEQIRILKECLTTNVPVILIAITDMGLEKSTYAILIHPKNTFRDLIYDLLLSTDSATMTDFWCKKRDPTRNRVTGSRIWWERQEPVRRICEVVTATGVEESLGIERVTKSGEYVVVLVEENRMERGVPVGLPQDISRSAKDHLQNEVFPNHELPRILTLHDNEDASGLPFNRLELPLDRSTLYVEANTRREVEDVSGSLGGNIPQINLDVDDTQQRERRKGKGRANLMEV